ncbi:HAMP domain-containing sensor histidine kinase [Microbacterium panaciterrae]
MGSLGERTLEAPGYRRSTRAIAWQVAAVCAVLVLLGGALALAYVFWQTRPAERFGTPDPGTVRVFLDPADLALAAVVVGIAAVACAGAAAWLIARRAVRPLEEAARIQRRFVADASHELRTPLAVLNARLQQLAALPPDDAQRQQTVQALRDDARIMSAIVDDMLATATGRPVTSGVAALGEVIAGAVSDMALLAEQRGVQVNAQPLTADVALPAAELRRCLVALLDNAIDHSPSGGVVTVSASRDGSVARIAVADVGAGIVGIDPLRVFDRFAHGAAPTTGAESGAESGTTGGSRTRFGIGLALVKELAERHGGGVRVAETGPAGTVFELTVPIAPGEAR